MEPPPEGVPPLEEAKMSGRDKQDRKAELLKSAKESGQEVLDKISEIQLELAELLDREILPLTERELEIRKEIVSLLKEQLEEAKLAQEKFQEALKLLTTKQAQH